MRLESRDLISRTTEGSARRLVLVSSAVLVLKVYGLQVNGEAYLSPTIPEVAFAQVMGAKIIFLAISHVVHWSADFVLYNSWFKAARVSKLDFFTQGSLNETEPTIVSVLKRLHNLTDSFSSVSDYIAREGTELEQISVRPNQDATRSAALERRIKGLHDKFDSLNEALSDIIEFAGQLDPGFRKANALSKLVICGWFLAVPLFVAFLAFLSLWPFAVDYLDCLRRFLGV